MTQCWAKHRILNLKSGHVMLQRDFLFEAKNTTRKILDQKVFLMGSGSSLLQSKPTRVLVMHNSYEGDMKSFMDDNKKAKSLQRAPSKGEEVARKLNLSSTKNFPINATQHFTVDPNGLDFNAVLLQIAKDMNEVLLFPITRQELDVTLLQIKILQNAGRVVSADRCSLFLIDQERQLLYAQVFHSVSPQSTGEFEVRHQVTVPLGKGIVGWVAKTGLTVNIEDAYKDQR